MDFEKMSLADLRSAAKEKGVKGYSALKKQELIELLSASETSAAKVEVKETKTAAVDGIVPEKYESAKTSFLSRPAAPGREDRTVSDRRADGRTDTRNDGRNINRSSYGAEGRNARQYEQRGPQDLRNQRDGRSARSERQERADRLERPEQRTERPEQRTEQRTERPEQRTERPEQRMRTDFRQPSAAVSGRIVPTSKITSEEREALDPLISPDIEQLDSGETKTGILEIVENGYGFIRCDNFLPGENDVYVSPAQIRRFNLKTGDIITGNTKIKTATEKFSALLYIKDINGLHPSEAVKRPKFEDLTPVFPNCRLHLETPGCSPAMRIVDLLSPIGKGQRGMIVSQPKAGKTTLLKQVASALTRNYPDLHLIILLIDERPEEVTDMKESIQGPNVEVIYSTFDELPENHKRVSEMVIERAKRLVEHKKDVVILLDSITRLARAYNLTVTASGRTLSGGLDPAALHMPKKFFGAARCMREGGSLTILATALVETGSRMDDVVFEEFKGTGNMELVLDRNLSERRIFPAIDLPKSSTRREDLLLNADEVEANNILRRAFNSNKSDDAVERIINMFAHTKSNREFIEVVKKTKLY